MAVSHKTWLLRGLSFVALFAWMGLIFFFSSQDADSSSSTSGQVIDKVAEQTVDGYKNYTQAEKDAFIFEHQHIVRKLAHFAEYVLLGILAFLTLSTLPIKPSLRPPAAFLFGVLFATTDELHQMLSAGRSCQWSDILLDSSGVLAGVLAALLLTAWVRKATHKT